MTNKSEIFQVFFYEEDKHDDEAKYAVIVSKYKNSWVFCRHKDRTTLEVPGGHVEQGETPDETAERELYEETGAVSYDLKRICTYGVQYNSTENYGVLYYADINKMGKLPDLEIAETVLLNDLPSNLTYPHIQPNLFYFVNNIIKKQTERKNKQYKAVLFDLDGTIFDNFGAVEKAVKDMYDMEERFHIFNFEKFRDLYLTLQDKFFYMFRDGLLEWKYQRMLRFKSLYSHFGIQLSDDEAYEKFEEYLKLFESHWGLLDCTYDLLNDLKQAGYKIGMVTNGEINQQIKKMDGNNITHFFESIAASTQYDFAKPDKELFDVVLDELNVSPQDAIFVGDSIRSDICGANNAHMDSIFVKRWHNSDYEMECEPTYVIHRLEEIYHLIDIKKK